MSVKSIVSTIADFAPTIAGLIGGPFAKTAITLLENAFGVKEDALEDAIRNDPNAWEKLKKLEYDHKEALIKLQVDDSINARNREIKVTEITGKRDWVPSALAFVFVTIYAVIQCWAIYNPGNQDDIISARLQDIILIIASYYYGNIHNGKEKT